MLPSSFRIKTRSTVTRILKKGKELRSDLLLARIFSNKVGYFRFAVITSKKVSPKAVERNRVRRQVHEAISHSWNSLPKACYDVVILVHPRILKAPYITIERDFSSLIKKFPHE